MTQIIFLCVFAFLAGFIDSIVGGGGLIQLPALLVFLPSTPLTLIFGTNKLSSIAGTSAAVISYSKAVKFNLKISVTSAIFAFIFSFIGAKTVSVINPAIMRPIVLVLLVIVAIYTFFKKDFGSEHIPKTRGVEQVIYAALIGTSLGFYDGFLGPGTGSFLIFAFIGILGFDFLKASASAKIVNFCTNLAALIYFASTHNIIYQLALPMAICNIIGATVGARVAIVKGSAFIRVLFITVVSLLIIKLAYDISVECIS
ncbi:TSUP family transporter [Aliterella atlantica]|uniref:Probable membrane transporter protein n=1 Tax=Aliterella atlantica CENA595 TaxID=1618023 RepID=A0A0D8ZSJ2_9CYAN|nr:TSUP family transporter [Aliterella atlantica]KJH71327.1 membrane protein [Aliterella atlantica CENA595]